jgi:hypothetical protein
LNVCQAITERLRRLFRRVADALDYIVTLVRLRILDALAGPEQRKQDREQVKGRSRKSRREELIAAEFSPADRFARDLH